MAEDWSGWDAELLRLEMNHRLRALSEHAGGVKQLALETGIAAGVLAEWRGGNPPYDAMESASQLDAYALRAGLAEDPGVLAMLERYHQLAEEPAVDRSGSARSGSTRSGMYLAWAIGLVLGLVIVAVIVLG